MGDEEVRQAKQGKTQKVEKPKKQDIAKAPVKKEEKKEGGKEKKSAIEQAKEKIEEAKAKEEATGIKKKDEEKKVILEREYEVPLRKEWLKVPEYKRANKAVKALKQFIAQHMKIYDRDLRKVKIDVLLNNEIRFRGMKKPPAKIKVKAIKNDDGTVDVKLVDIPKHIEFEIARKAKKEVEKLKKAAPEMAQAPEGVPSSEGKEEAKPAEGEKSKEDDANTQKGMKKRDEKEKVAASKEATQALEKAQAKQAKHTSIKRAPIVQRKAMQK